MNHSIGRYSTEPPLTYTGSQSPHSPESVSVVRQNPTTSEITVRGVKRSYMVGENEVRALRGVDLSVASGEFVGIVGVSGSGKSTLLHLIGGLDTADEGEITVAGKSLLTMNAY